MLPDVVCRGFSSEQNRAVQFSEAKSILWARQTTTRKGEKRSSPTMHSTAQDNHHHHQSMSVIGGVSQSLESATAADQSVVYRKVNSSKWKSVCHQTSRQLIHHHQQCQDQSRVAPVSSVALAASITPARIDRMCRWSRRPTTREE